MKRVFSLLLTFAVVLSVLLPCALFSASEEPLSVLVGSDFQQGSHEGSAAIVSSITAQVKAAGVTTLDGFLFCGDYDRNTIGSSSETLAGLNMLKSTMAAEFPQIAHSVYVQGNHDPANTPGLSPSGANDAEGYGVFVVNNKDYMWYNSDEATIAKTAESLRAYLEEKLEEGYTKPIFVVSHLPLHYSARTVNDGDAQYADYLFNELNEAGARGLNIVFLYGHDHSNGWDNHLGGAAVLLKKGDTIRIAQSSRTTYKDQTLFFTYMNAGYTGYYSDNNGADNTMTMCLFTIAGASLTVSRYDAQGLHDLKSAGTYNSKYDDRGYVTTDQTVYPSPQEVEMSTEIVGKVTFEDDATGVSAGLAGQGIEVFSAQDGKISERFGNTALYRDYTAYTVEPVGSFDGVRATVRIPIDAFDASATRVYRLENGRFTRLNASFDNGRAVVETPLPATLIAVECLVGEVSYTRIQTAADLEPGDGYLFSYNDAYFMMPQVKSYNSRVGFALEESALARETSIASDMTGYTWTLTSADGGWLLGDGEGWAKLTDTADRRVTATLESEGTTLQFAGSSGLFTISGGGFVFNFNESRLLINGFASNPASFAIYKYSAAFLEDARPPKGDYDGLLWTLEERDGGYALKNAYADLYLGCGGNATLNEDGAKLGFISSGESFKIKLGENIGGKTTSDYLHFGTANRCSFGEASLFTFYEQTNAETFRKTGALTAGKSYLVVYESGNTHCALSESVYGAGGSSRIETKAIEIPTDPYDLDGDGEASIVDVTLLLGCLTAAGSARSELLLSCGAFESALDLDGSGAAAIPDVTRLLNALAVTLYA